MADMVKCPVCSENNLAGSEFCQYCQSRLQPLTGNLKGADAPITPGQSPTKKSTADLEPILPQWLRDVRSSARDASEAEAAEGELPQIAQPQTSPHSDPQDLLAGLRSQSDDEDEVPDWLTNLGGAPGAKKPKEESSDMRWVELGGAKDSAPESDVPSWMQELNPPEFQSDKKDELNDWMREASGSQPPAASESGDSQDWLRHLAADDKGALFNDPADTSNAAPNKPDWLNTPSASHDEEPSDKPDWLRSLGVADSNAQDSLPSSADVPDWLNLNKADSTPQNADTPDWLQGLNSETPSAPASPQETADWLKSLDAVDSTPQSAASADTPDWLQGLGSETPAAPAPSETADWLKSLDAADSTPQSAS
ncbi:MAG: zinc ribbon domain-containing protein, partial [Anaerolineales bacterium]|nr:zinc ribbon domain-containing protein [Anaerolineales bacterium]